MRLLHTFLAWACIGTRLKFLKKCAQQLLDDFDGQVPQTREELESLAGVGRKTANVVMSVGFGIPAFAVDTHVERISKHHDIVKNQRHLLRWKSGSWIILPPEQWLAAHQAMIYFGRAICHPKNPECDQYPQLYDFSNFIRWGLKSFLLDFRSTLCYSI